MGKERLPEISGNLTNFMERKNITYYLYFTLCFLCSFPAFAGQKWSKKKPDNCENYIIVQGSSNMNKFELFHEQIELLEESDQPKQAFTKSINVPVDKFSAQNHMMLKDFLKLVKADEFPCIKIQVQLKDLNNKTIRHKCDSLVSQITMAGNSQEYTIPCKYIFCDSSKVLIQGIFKVKLSDFNLEPPTKALGVIKVDDEVFITFAFTQIINNNQKKT